MNNNDTLADGTLFIFWEKDCKYSKELFVNQNAANASDSNDGSKDSPFKTIQAAAGKATPGTHIWIYPGEYRECVHPRCGGTDAENMICYEAVEKDSVVIKASEQVTDFYQTDEWQYFGFGTPLNEQQNISVWSHKLSPEMFKGYNPFCAVNIIHDRLFIEFAKTDMTTYLNRRGMIFCDGKPLLQVPLSNDLSKKDGTYWVESNGMTVHFRLPGDENPKNHKIELSCREQCFAPEEPFLSFIKVKGLICAHATMGAPIPQRGSISAYRGNHWIIEDCTVDWSNATGIDVGNECWHHTLKTEKKFGYSIIRRCKILNAGVCGIAGLYAEEMLVEDNLIEGTGWQKMELSWEAGALKFHNSTNALFRRNVFRNTFRADHIWLDCGNVNNRITQNVFCDGIEQREAIFIECTREGINLIDNNIFWNVEGRFDPNQIPVEPGSSGWYKYSENEVVNGYAVYGEGTDRMHINNNFIGKCRSAGYFAKPVPFRIMPGDRGGTSRNAELLNNIFYDCQEAAIKMPTRDNKSEGNVFARMPGGYLRILNPTPEVCLDLKSWKEFYGFDTEGQEGWFDVEIDTKNLTMKFVKSSQMPFSFHPEKLSERYIFEVEKLKPVSSADFVKVDFFGNEKSAKKSLPGPFSELKTDFVYNIDPRKL